MAEVALAAVLQPVLAQVWKALTMAYSAYDGVQSRREQLLYLLNRCKSLLEEFRKLPQGTNFSQLKDILEHVKRCVQ